MQPTATASGKKMKYDLFETESQYKKEENVMKKVGPSKKKLLFLFLNFIPHHRFLFSHTPSENGECTVHTAHCDETPNRTNIKIKQNQQAVLTNQSYQTCLLGGTKLERQKGAKGGDRHTQLHIAACSTQRPSDGSRAACGSNSASELRLACADNLLSV